MSKRNILRPLLTSQGRNAPTINGRNTLFEQVPLQTLGTAVHTLLRCKVAASTTCMPIYVQAGELLLAPPLQSAAPLLPARLRAAASATSDLLFGPLPQAGNDTETAAWQVSRSHLHDMNCSAILHPKAALSNL